MKTTLAKQMFMVKFWKILKKGGVDGKGYDYD
jgi:hypothetical protein